MAQQINILMTGGGAPGAAGIINCLKQEPGFNIITGDINPDAVGKFLTADFVKLPVASDPGFATTVREICIKKKIQVVMPLVTKELLPFAKEMDRFNEAGIKLLVSPFSSLEIANDKSRLYQFLEWRDIPVPAYRVVQTVPQFEEAVKDLGYPAKPVCFKPSVSNGSRGFRVIDERVDELDLLFNFKPVSTYIGFDQAKRILSSGIFPELLVSEFLPGDEFSVDCLADHGEAVLVVPRLRKRMISGISVEGEFTRDENMIAYCRDIIRELKLHGNIGIQVKRSAAGKFLILEINPRVQGTISAALGAGINLPVLAVKQELGLQIRKEELEVKWGTRFVRYWNEVFYS